MRVEVYCLQLHFKISKLAYYNDRKMFLEWVLSYDSDGNLAWGLIILLLLVIFTSHDKVKTMMPIIRNEREVFV